MVRQKRDLNVRIEGISCTSQKPKYDRRARTCQAKTDIADELAGTWERQSKAPSCSTQELISLLWMLAWVAGTLCGRSVLLRICRPLSNKKEPDFDAVQMSDPLSNHYVLHEPFVRSGRALEARRCAEVGVLRRAMTEA